MPSNKKSKSVKKPRPVKAVKVVKPVKAVNAPEPLRAYDITQRTHERRLVLQHDGENWGLLKVLKQLNEVREAQQWNPRVHDIMTKDLEFLEKLYQRERKN